VTNVAATYKDVAIKKNKLPKIIKNLNATYETMPETKGCMENINKEGGCEAWCCQSQNPQVLYVEFYNAWQKVMTTWPNEKIVGLVRGALRNYLSNESNKGCIFWDKETKLCGHHETRPYNCRIYGVIPEEEFKPRYERLKVLNPNVKDQCNLVSAIGNQPTKKDTDAWWESIRKLEQDIGIPSHLITDEPGGSYRTYHDHILIQLFSDKVLNELTLIRLNQPADVKEKVMEGLIKAISKALGVEYVEEKTEIKSTSTIITLEGSQEITQKSSGSGEGANKIILL
jgi:Fe-S-cluster containining protein